jgi:amino acid adenylation domain-containing protein/thioester reductase-like protein
MGPVPLIQEPFSAFAAGRPTDLATFDQEGFWVAAELGLAPEAARTTRVMTLRGPVPADPVWRQAWAALLERHPALRSGFHRDAEQRLNWRTVASAELGEGAALAIDDCAGPAQALALIQAVRLPLSEPPLARAGLIRITEGGERLFWFAFHPAVADGHSVPVLEQDLLALLAGQSLAPAAHGLALASRAEQAYFRSPQAAADRDFWSGQLAALVHRGSDAFAEFLPEWPRPELPSGQGAPILSEHLQAGTVAALERLARGLGAGLHAVLLAILAHEVRRRGGPREVLLGSGSNLRPAGAMGAVGPFGNALPVLLPDPGAAPFAGLIAAAQAALNATVEHAGFPSALLYREFRTEYPQARALSRSSLVDIALAFAPGRALAQPEPGLELKPRALPGALERPPADLDFAFFHEPCPEDGGLDLSLIWNPDICPQSTAEAWLAAFAGWARWLAEPERITAAIPELLPQEATRLDAWERGPERPRRVCGAHELFETWAEAQPEHPALLGRERRQSYGELDASANGIAWRLLRQGLRPGGAVGVLTLASWNLPAVVLGIWKAGGIYLPLPADLPPGRLQGMAEDATMALLVALDGLATPAELATAALIRPETCDPDPHRPPPVAIADQAAFLIYTSGTTGRPKGVPVPHGGYMNAILSSAENAQLRPADRVALVASVGFDAWLWELGLGLFAGASLVPIAPSLRDNPWQLKVEYRDLGVSLAFHTPSYLRLSEAVPFEGMRNLFIGGEAPGQRDIRLHAHQTQLWNCYGPTETSVIVSMGRIAAEGAGELPITVGGPLPNAVISLRRADGSRVPPGACGELWLGGVGVAQGYLRQPERTAEMFLDTAEGRFYRSGDYGRWTAAGTILIQGRVDHQVKLNGIRVELGEIEAALRSHPAVVDAVVLVTERANATRMLEAFYTQRETVVPERLEAFLAQRLPVHMRPATLTPLAAMPQTPAGKLDRKALEQSPRATPLERPFSAPRPGLETQVAALWTGLFGIQVGRDDNFFALGGNSLLAVVLAHQVTQTLGLEVSVRSVFTAPTLAAFAERLEDRAGEPLPGPASDAWDAQAEGLEPDLATGGEREFWIAQEAGLATGAFNIPLQFRLDPGVTEAAIAAAWAALVLRHGALRSFYQEDETGLLRRLEAPAPATRLESAQVADAAQALEHIRQRQAEPLAMGAAPLWRLGIVEARAEATRHLWLALHHGPCDGQSVTTLVGELASLLAHGELAPAGPGPGLFSIREQAYAEAPAHELDAEFWAGQLQALADAAWDEWPLDAPRSAGSEPGCHRLDLVLDAETSAGLGALARSHAASDHALMITLLGLEARRRSGRGEMLIGTTVSLRERAADAQAIGYGLNMLPLTFRAGASFGQSLAAAQRGLAAALQHARLPFAEIYRAFWNDRPHLRNPLRFPLFDLVVTRNPEASALAGPQLTRPLPAPGALGYERSRLSPGQDLVLIHEQLGNGQVLLQLHVNAGIHSRATAESWLAALTGWARWLTQDPARASGPLPLLLPREAELLAAWEQGAARPRPDLRFHELFEAVVDRPGQAERPALLTAAASRSYADLDRAANAIAHGLELRGVGPGDRVGVFTGRSPNLPAAVLGVWKAGAVYLPLTPDLPPERLAFMASDAGVKQLIVLDGLPLPAALAAARPAPLRPEALTPAFLGEHAGRVPRPGRPGDGAYLLYTSGSTGAPKGALISHAAFVNLALGTAETLGLSARDRYLQFAAPSFDASLSDLGAPLAVGAALCPAPAGVIESPSRFLDFLRAFAVTVADLTPSYLRLFEGAALAPSLRVLVTGGEAPIPADVARYADRVAYFNAYGPTETAVTSTMARLQGDGREPLPAGRPLPNTSVHIRGPQGQALPPGVQGEIWLGGAGLGLGYLQRPELTAAAFLETPEGRRYRSGDLGRWSADGQLLIAGRADDQVKRSGIRFELGEIEHALGAHPAITQAVVLLLDEPAGLWAAACAAPGQELPADPDWRAHLAQRLPAHMIPAGLIALAAMPRTSAGKVDRKALRALLASAVAAPDPLAPAPVRDDLERAVAEAWSAVLGQDPIQDSDDFFALGGHSLLAIAVAHRLERTLDREVQARDLFAEPTLAGFAQRLRSAPARPAADAAGSDRATEGQREFWTAEQAGLASSAFNLSLTLEVQGAAPDLDHWQAAWAELCRRHEALRTGFYEDAAGLLRRRILPQAAAPLEIRRAPSLAEARAAIQARQAEPFALAVPGLVRAGLVEAGGPWLFWCVLHHAIADGLSLGILVQDLSGLLAGASLAPVQERLDLTAGTEAAYLESAAAGADAAYWQATLQELLTTAPGALAEWPLDAARPRTRPSAGGHALRAELDPATTHGLRALARRNGASLHALMLSLLGIEVWRRTGRSGFLLGTAASTRRFAAEAQTLGYFVNMLALPCRPLAGATVDGAVRAMQRTLAEALQHAQYPFARVYADFRRDWPQPGHPGRHPLFDLVVAENPALAPASGSGLGLPRQTSAPYELRPQAPPQDLVLVHEPRADGGLALTWHANAALYSRETAQAWFAGLLELLTTVASAPAGAIEQLRPPARTEAEPVANPGACVHQTFEALAARNPAAPALVAGSEVLSYGELNARANRLAHALLEAGLKLGDLVAIALEPTPEVIVALLATLKAGGAYLPLDPHYPAERLAYLLADSGARFLVTREALLPDLPPSPARTLLLDAPPRHSNRNPGIAVSPRDLAYVIYTSGSTGKPKGVALGHAGLANLAEQLIQVLRVTPRSRVLQFVSFSFDVSVGELVTALCAGASLHFPSAAQRLPGPALFALLADSAISHLILTPAPLAAIPRGPLPDLECVVTGGEPCALELAAHWSQGRRLINAYGPTEATVVATYAEVTPALLAAATPLPIGRPLAKVHCHVLDPELRPVPEGEPGELVLGGVGLAHGYLHRPELTARQFVPDPFSAEPGARLYRTGDRVRLRPDGQLEFLGRIDQQVKIRGFRIELGEIEAALGAHPELAEAVVVARPEASGEKRLVAVVVWRGPEGAVGNLRSFLKGVLPDHMLPSAFVTLERLPLTATGKIDREALLTLDPFQAAPVPGSLHTPTERQVAAVWAECLGLAALDRNDDFFERGGDSLRAIAVISRLRREFQITVNDLYEHPVLAAFAQRCRPLAAAEPTPATARIAGPDLMAQRTAYELRVAQAAAEDLRQQHPYGHVLLTGATGYLGCHLLRELLADPGRSVVALVRAADPGQARARLGEALVHHFGPGLGAALRDQSRLRVLAGDLRAPDLRLPAAAWDELAATTGAIFHAAANVNHVGHYRDFAGDNVAATSHLLALAGAGRVTDFHLISTLSVTGRAEPGSAALFTEFDGPPAAPDENYYIRTKQEAERLVLAARGSLGNACIHRVGNLGFATEGAALQRNLTQNAFFRLVVACLRLGAVPADLPAGLCPVDVTARAVLALASCVALDNRCHHIETSRRDRLADILGDNPDQLQAVDRATFLDRLQRALVAAPGASVLAEALEALDLPAAGSAPAARGQVLLACELTQARLRRLGITWPDHAEAGRRAFLSAALAAAGLTPSAPSPLGGTRCHV